MFLSSKVLELSLCVIVVLALSVLTCTATNGGIPELPFLDLGDESRVNGEGKFFGALDHAVLLNTTKLPVSFNNGTETNIFVSWIMTMFNLLRFNH